ncbi:hypothetical protein BCR37DRAFT_392561 [Protomyces lactucae-debilis]|uniref:Uncharacterized protein n=1 Tax=Protomyces lactucae-debilis TaxID=2754530 RepID=A0A1Y2FH14_PROLT|nr:uncharacterized protein BCR37DRAFT_392561 [Protomyces lactucae-debilis]ORY83219.1 hypothetical protein BCR37DRAFT_392561 [Protomyces lactucae-debilis]
MGAFSFYHSSQMSHLMRRGSLTRANSIYGFIRSRQNSPGDLMFEVQGGDIQPLEDASPTAGLSPASASMRRCITSGSDLSASPTRGIFQEFPASPSTLNFGETRRNSIGAAAMLFIPRYNPERPDEYKRAHQHIFGGRASQFSPPDRPPPSPPATRTGRSPRREPMPRHLSATSQPDWVSSLSSPPALEEVKTPETDVPLSAWLQAEPIQWNNTALGGPLSSTVITRSPSPLKPSKRRPRPTPLCLASSSFIEIEKRSASMSSGSSAMYTQSSAVGSSTSESLYAQRSPMSPLAKRSFVARSGSAPLQYETKI